MPEPVEVLADHPRVVEHLAFVGDEARYLAERVHGLDGVVGAHRRDRLVDELEPVEQAGLVCPSASPIRRCQPLLTLARARAVAS